MPANAEFGVSSVPPLAHGGMGLVATDLDGTLLDSHKRVSPRTQAVLAQLDECHIPLVIATGRPVRWLPPVWEQLPVRPLCICMNGAVIYDSFHRQVLRRVVLKPTVLQDIVQSVHEALPEACFAVERITSEMTPSTGEGPVEEFLIAENNEHIWYEQNAPRTSLAALAEEPAAKLLVRAEDISSAEMAEMLCPLVEPVANATYSVDGGLVEISHPVATKGEALVRILDYWDLSEETLLAFGDMPNDMDMLELAAWGVAVENAHPAVQAAADEVTVSNDEDGVAVVLERLLGA